MDIYQVIFEECKGDGTITEVIEYVQAKDLKTVAVDRAKRAEEMGWTLKSVRYALTVVEKIKNA